MRPNDLLFIRFTLKRNKPDNSCPASARLSEEVADDRDDYEFLMQASTVRPYIDPIHILQYFKRGRKTIDEQEGSEMDKIYSLDHELFSAALLFNSI